jgi:hypothetical protein
MASGASLEESKKIILENPRSLLWLLK